MAAQGATHTMWWGCNEANMSFHIDSFLIFGLITTNCTLWQCTKKLPPHNSGKSIPSPHLALIFGSAGWMFSKNSSHTMTLLVTMSPHIPDVGYMVAKGAMPLTLIYSLFLAMQKGTTTQCWKPLASSPHIHFWPCRFMMDTTFLMCHHNFGCQVCGGTKCNPHKMMGV